MLLNQMLINKIKQDVVSFAIEETENFLKENEGKIFYAFAFDLNAEYGELNLCFNTKEDFNKTLQHYQNSNSSCDYRSEEEIQNLKYNTGDWEYQCFSTIYPISENELTAIFQKLPNDDLLSKFIEEIVQIFSECLTLFKQTETYQKIPKTTDFIVFTIDHDEEVEEALSRLDRY
ncbi:DUF4303 domain-containing protein [Proteus hauseri]|uniref:DUF4303 domain-containing protein n=1 Tax=Proteus hauseri TaxID=183417 RepID=UPI0032DB7937